MMHELLDGWDDSYTQARKHVHSVSTIKPHPGSRMPKSAVRVILAETILPEPADCPGSFCHWVVPEMATGTLCTSTTWKRRVRLV